MLFKFVKFIYFYSQFKCFKLILLYLYKINFNWFSHLLILTSVVNISLALYVIKKKNVPGNFYFSLLLFACSEWAILNAIEYMVPVFTTKILLSKISYIGLTATPPLLLYFSLHFTRLNEKINLRYLPLIWILPVIILFSTFTNEYHYLLWKEYIPVDSIIGQAVFYKTGPLIFLYAGFSYIMLISSMYVLLVYYSKINRIFKSQALLLILSFIFPWIGNFMYLTRINPFPELDITPLAFCLTCVTLFLAIVKAELFGLVPHGKEILFLSMPDAVLVLDYKLRIIDLNPSAKNIFGEFDYLGLKIYDIFPEINYNLFKGNNFPVKFEYKINKNNISIWFDVLISEISGKSPDADGYLVVFRDIDNVKKSEELLKESEKKLIELNADKDKFFSLMAHDLKNPISSFMQITELFSNEYYNLTEEDKYEIVETLKNSSNRIYELLQNILTWSRLQRGLIEYSPSLINLKTIIELNVSMLKTYTDNKNISIKVFLGDNTIAYADANMLVSTIRNLLSNAIKFTSKGGEISISCSDYINDDTTDKNRYVKISISDNGIGLSEDDINKLFRIDTSSRMIGTSTEKGSGLGLILCKDFIEKHKGKIWVDSKLGYGSTFSFTIPKYENN